jgi:hypothetical protein
MQQSTLLRCLLRLNDDVLAATLVNQFGQMGLQAQWTYLAATCAGCASTTHSTRTWPSSCRMVTTHATAQSAPGS